MTRIAIVYHSEKGRTEIVAQEIARGAQDLADTVSLIKIDGSPVDWEILHQADAIIFGSPTYMGSASGIFKTFMDSTSDIWMRHEWKNKIAGGFVNSYAYSGDKLTVLQQLTVFAAQHGMIWVGVDDMTQGPKPEHLNRLGSFVGVMTQSDSTVDALVPPQGDRDTAYNYGRRIATIAARFTNPSS